MVTRVQKWGNSQGLRITRQVLEDTGIEVGDEVDNALPFETMPIARRL